MGMVGYGASVLDSKNQPIAGVAVSLSPETVVDIGEKIIVENLKNISIKISIRPGAEL